MYQGEILPDSCSIPAVYSILSAERRGSDLAASGPTSSERLQHQRRGNWWQEQTARSAKAVSLAKQGQWMHWEGVERRKISWRELWEMEASNISFSISGLARIQPVPSAQLQQTSNTSWQTVRAASLRADTPGSTIRFSRAWHKLLRTNNVRPTLCPREQLIPWKHQLSSVEDRKRPNILPPSQKESVYVWHVIGRC